MSDALRDAAAAVDEYCRQTHDGSYAGIRREREKVVVYRRATAGFDRAVQARFPTARLVFREAAHSARTLEAVRARITADRQYWRARGVVISTIAVPADGSAVEVGTPQAERVRKLLQDRYGKGVVRVTTKSAELFGPFSGPIPGLPRKSPNDD